MKRTFSFILTLVMVIGVLTSVPVTVSAASTSDLTFELNEDGTGYEVVGCNKKVIGELIIPDTYKFLPVTSIGKKAFLGCADLTSISIPDSVISIGANAFRDCISVKSITIPDSVKNIGYLAFYNTGYYNNRKNWDKYALYIGNHLIRGKRSLKGEYKVKEGTITIADRAFMYCDELTSVKYPSSVKNIGKDIFYGCDKIKE